MKKLLALLVTLTMVFTLCTSVVMGASAETAHEPITIRMSMTASLDEHHGAAANIFADYVMDKCDWITLEVYPSSTLFDDSDAIAELIRGNLDMCESGFPYLSEYAPVLAMFGSCYLFQNWDHVNAVLNGEIGEQLFNEIAETTDVRIIGAMYSGDRTVNLRQDIEVKTREDLDGIMLRMPNSEAWINIGKSLGATPVAMSLSEVYLALQSGTIDGQDNPLQATMSYGFGEVTKSITMTRHYISNILFCINEGLWESLDAETQQVFQDAFQEASDFCYGEYVADEDALIAEFEALGVSVYKPDTTQMREEVENWYWNEPGLTDSWDRELYDAIQDANPN